jgi:hypothetical protein
MEENLKIYYNGTNEFIFFNSTIAMKFLVEESPVSGKH